MLTLVPSHVVKTLIVKLSIIVQCVLAGLDILETLSQSAVYHYVSFFIGVGKASFYLRNILLVVAIFQKQHPLSPCLLTLACHLHVELMQNVEISTESHLVPVCLLSLVLRHTVDLSVLSTPTARAIKRV